MRKPNQSFYDRRSNRLRGYDYGGAGLYFVTICAYRHACLFGAIRSGDMILNELGRLVEEFWLKIAETRANTTLDAFVVMPNHLHGIIGIVGNERCRIRAISQEGDASRATTLASGSLGATVGQFKSAVTKQSRALARPPTSRIWQRSYYEHIIRYESALDEIRKYILFNPARWADDDLYVE